MTVDWMKQFPSVWATKNYHGNKELAKNYDGEGRKLLYELKNRMRLGNLQQLKMTRYFDNGLVIVATSVFGHDTIDITHPTIERQEIYFTGMVATWLKSTNRIYFISEPTSYFIDLNAIAPSIYAGVLFKVVAHYGMMGVFVYSETTYPYASEFKVLKFNCAMSKVNPEETEDFEGTTCYRSTFSYSIETIPGVAASGATALPCVTTLADYEFPPSVGEFILDSNVPGAVSQSVSLRCLSVWTIPSDSIELNSLKYEIGGTVLAEHVITYRLHWSPELIYDVCYDQDDPAWCTNHFSNYIYSAGDSLPYLVSYNNGSWTPRGAVFPDAVLYVDAAGGQPWPYPNRISVQALASNVGVDLTGDSVHKGEDPDLQPSVIPILNANGIGVAGYWVVYRTVYMEFGWGWLKDTTSLWWTITGERYSLPMVEWSAENNVWLRGYSLYGGGYPTRASIKIQWTEESEFSPFFTQSIESIYRINGVIYEGNDTIPDAVFNSGKYLHGRVTHELIDFANQWGLNYVPIIDQIPVVDVVTWGSPGTLIGYQATLQAQISPPMTDKLATATLYEYPTRLAWPGLIVKYR